MITLLRRILIAEQTFRNLVRNAATDAIATMGRRRERKYYFFFGRES